MIFHIFNQLYYRFRYFAANSNSIFQKIFQNLFLDVFYSIAGKRLKRKAAKCKSIEDYVDLALNYKCSLFKDELPIIILTPQQIESELLAFSKFIYGFNPKNILEIGTANGGTFFLLSRLSGEDSTLISIDLPINAYIGGIDYKSKAFYKSFALNSQKIEIIRGDSHKKSSLREVKGYLNGDKLDLLFIDGDHTYKGVKKDFKLYSPLVRKHGIIAFHDIVKVPSDENVEVNKFWNDLKKNYKYYEFVEDWNQGYCGIGIIFKDTKI